MGTPASPDHPDEGCAPTLQDRYIRITAEVALCEVAVSSARRDRARYAARMPFRSDDLERIDRAEEVDIETSAADGTPHRTTIWAVVDGSDVFVRSYVGANARWWREATANPEVALWVDGRRLPATAVLAADPASIARTSAGLERKYADDAATPRMVRDEVLPLTLRLEPAS